MRANALTAALASQEDRLEFELGVAAVYERAPSGVRYSTDYRARGATAYTRLRRALAPQLCDPKTGALRPWVALVADGDVRELAVAILALGAGTLGLSAAIAVPVAALIAKRGLKGICSDLPKKQTRQPRVTATRVVKKPATKKKARKA
jgi:hypothetical protein